MFVQKPKMWDCLCCYPQPGSAVLGSEGNNDADCEVHVFKYAVDIVVAVAFTSAIGEVVGVISTAVVIDRLEAVGPLKFRYCVDFMWR